MQKRKRGEDGGGGGGVRDRELARRANKLMNEWNEWWAGQ